MKKVFSLLITVFAILFFVGCASKGLVPEVKKDGNNITIYPIYCYYKNYDKDSEIYIIKNLNNHSESKFNLSEMLKRASEETIFSGNKYFGILSTGTNNLNGFPITNYSDLLAYCFPYQEKQTNFVDQGRNDKCSVLTEDSLKIVMFKEQAPGLYLWDANQTLKDLY